MNKEITDQSRFDTLLSEIENYIQKGMISETAGDAAYELSKPSIKIKTAKGDRSEHCLVAFVEIQNVEHLLSTYMRLVDLILEFPRITFRQFDFIISFSDKIDLSRSQKEQLKARIVNGLCDTVDEYANEKHLDIDLVRSNIVIK